MLGGLWPWPSIFALLLADGMYVYCALDSIPLATTMRSQKSRHFGNHARLIFTYTFYARITDYIRMHRT